MSEKEPRIVYIACRADDGHPVPAGQDRDCQGRQAEVVDVLSTAEVHGGMGGQPSTFVGGGHATTYRCLACNRRFMIST